MVIINTEEAEGLEGGSGIYVLFLKVLRPFSSVVGILGTLSFSKGYYVYVGSAQRNLWKRIERHLSTSKKKRWHIDYLLDGPVKILSIYVLPLAPKKEEEEFANFLLMNGAKPVLHFGSSDSKAISHLFGIKNRSFLESLLMRFSASS